MRLQAVAAAVLFHPRNELDLHVIQLNGGTGLQEHRTKFNSTSHARTEHCLASRSNWANIDDLVHYLVFCLVLDIVFFLFLTYCTGEANEGHGNRTGDVQAASGVLQVRDTGHRRGHAEYSPAMDSGAETRKEAGEVERELLCKRVGTGLFDIRSNGCDFQ